ncbi:uncharacterized protein LOC112569155 [Pomacea canaliculata]|uniref:uncharacterized protein LOC112569155 n=1 Tax=Pomacea canaliculata TaxID=400727 RepID=UPI000D7268EB|nr:uncharacterized protein LOC112569155 [Pomacea canaliculata]
MLTSDYLDAASSFRRTVILALFVAFLFTVIEAAGEEKLTLEANPDQPLTRENNTGDNVTLTCKGMIHPTSTFLSFSVLHTLDEEVTTYVSKVFPTGSMPTANVSAELVGCYAGDYVLCQGISSKFSYNENGSLAIVVVIKSFLCRLRGLWKCKVIFRYAGRLEDITMKAHLTFHGFSWPSNLTLTFGESHKEMNKVAVIAGSQVLLTCRGNVGSTNARLIFVSYHHNGTEAQRRMVQRLQGK